MDSHLPIDDQICRLALSATGCPLGPLHCPLRHTTPSVQNFQPPKQLPTHPRERERLATVCKHWLRGLCKKGDACEFLHEYNLRRMPECWWYAKYNYCSAGDECLYAHPKERRVECPDYNRGFCKLGASRFHAMSLHPPSSMPSVECGCCALVTVLISVSRLSLPQAPTVLANMSGASHANYTSPAFVPWALTAREASTLRPPSGYHTSTDITLPARSQAYPLPRLTSRPSRRQ